MTSQLTDAHDEVLMNLLVENKTLVNFLFSVFGFLGRKTDFYMIMDEHNKDSMGFPPGVAEELVVKILRKCDPFNTMDSEEMNFKVGPSVEYTPNHVAEEVEIETSDFESHSKSSEKTLSGNQMSSEVNDFERCQSEEIRNVQYMENLSLKSDTPDEFCKMGNGTTSKNNKLDMYEERYEPEPMRSEDIDKVNSAESQKDSESYNGAKCDKYKWSQSIGELDVTIPLPTHVRSSKQVRVSITSNVLQVDYQEEGSWQVLIKDNLTHRIKSGETVWIMSEGKLRVHIEKQIERWWTSLLENEPKIDTTRIDCSRPLDELPEEHIAKVRELKWNQLQKAEGKPTSEDLQKHEILKKAWNMEGSPFANTPFDPSVLQ